MKITIGKRLGFAIAIFMILLIFVAGFGYYTIHKISHLAETVNQHNAENIFIIEKEVDHLSWLSDLDLYLMKMESEFLGELDGHKCGFGEWIYSEEVKKINDPELKRLINEIEGPHQALHASAEKIIHAREEGNDALALQIYQDETKPNAKKVHNILDHQLSEIYHKDAELEAKNMSESAQRSTVIILGVGIFASVLGIVLASIITRQIIKVLKNIGREIYESSQQVASASEQLSVSSQQLAEGSAEQASSIEETSSTLEESSSMIMQNTENAKQASMMAKEARDAADKGNGQMQEMVSSMSELKKSSDEIAQIIKVIDDIAFQTNILALNAAVEAARAGDAGMGFAVVADEVRNLAQRSAQAAKDTSAIIEKNIELSENGVEVSEKVNKALEDINLKTQKVNELLDEVSAASQEQSQGISQINKAIQGMDQVVQQNASTSEESALASEELSAQAKAMEESVRRLFELVEGNSKGKDFKQEKIFMGRKKRSAPQSSKGLIVEQSKALVPENKKNLGNKPTIISPDDVIPLEDDTADF